MSNAYLDFLARLNARDVAAEQARLARETELRTKALENAARELRWMEYRDFLVRSVFGDVPPRETF